MLDDLDAAARVVYDAMPATPQQRWPLLDARCGTAVWVKHENQTPVGAFKVRGGLVYFDHLRSADANVGGVVAATRGNHGQSVAFAARRYAIPAAVVVPRGNSPAKNRAMRALGAELIESGHDFQDALEAAAAHCRRSRAGTWYLLRPAAGSRRRVVCARVVQGRTRSRRPLCSNRARVWNLRCDRGARRHRPGDENRRRRLAAAPAYARSLELGHAVSHDASTRIADGMACRTPVPEASSLIRARCRARRRSHRRRNRGCDAGAVRGHAQRG